VLAVGGVEPDELMVGGGGEPEAFPAWLAEADPCGMGVFDDAPERMGPGFPDLADAVIGVFADFAPGTVRGVEHGVAWRLIGAVAAEAEGGAGRERGVSEEPERGVLPWAGQIQRGDALLR